MLGTLLWIYLAGVVGTLVVTGVMTRVDLETNSANLDEWVRFALCWPFSWLKLLLLIG